MAAAATPQPQNGGRVGGRGRLPVVGPQQGPRVGVGGGVEQEGGVAQGDVVRVQKDDLPKPRQQQGRHLHGEGGQVVGPRGAAGGAGRGGGVAAAAAAEGRGRRCPRRWRRRRRRLTACRVHARSRGQHPAVHAVRRQGGHQVGRRGFRGGEPQLDRQGAPRPPQRVHPHPRGHHVRQPARQHDDAPPLERGGARVRGGGGAEGGGVGGRGGDCRPRQPRPIPHPVSVLPPRLGESHVECARRRVRVQQGVPQGRSGRVGGRARAPGARSRVAASTAAAAATDAAAARAGEMPPAVARDGSVHVMLTGRRSEGGGGGGRERGARGGAREAAVPAAGGAVGSVCVCV